MPTTSTIQEEPPSPEAPSFAPTTSSVKFTKIRKRPPRLLNLDVPATKSAVAQIHEKCSVRNFSRPTRLVNTNIRSVTKSAIHGRLGWTKNLNFLEQFRYIIVASQLLSEHTKPFAYKRQALPSPRGEWPLKSEHDKGFKPGPVGLAITGITAVGLAYFIKRLQGVKLSDYSTTTLGIVTVLCIFLMINLYYYSRRQWLHYLRLRSMENATSLTTNAQNFEAAATAAFTLIQEVELVSRGYNMYELFTADFNI